MTKSSEGRACAILKLPNDHGGKEVDYASIEKLLMKLKGISSVSFNSLTSRVKIEYDPDNLTLEEIRKSLSTLANEQIAEIQENGKKKMGTRLS